MITREFPNWFQYALPNFQWFVSLSEWNETPLRVLQIGAYTGDSSVWINDHMLVHPSSVLHDVDTWEGSSGEHEHEKLDWSDVHSLYLQRIRNRPQIVPHRTTSNKFFATHPDRHYHFIYVDGAHTRDQVARDAANAHTALLPGGVLAFDDYTWQGHEPGNNPSDAIRPFRAEHADSYKVLVENTQLWLQKKQ